MTNMTYGDVDLNLIFVLERVLSRQSVTAAAADLGLSQPAASRALQRLRDALGDPLLVRAGRDMVPTDRARELLGPALAALEASRAVFAPPSDFDPASAQGELVVAMTDELQDATGAALFAAVAAAAPRVDLRFRALSLATVDHGRRGLLDVAVAPDLAAFPGSDDFPDLGEFVLQPLYRRRFCVVGARRRWPDPPDLDAYCAAGHVIVSFGGGGRGFVDVLLQDHGRSRRVAASVATFGAMGRLVAGTELLGVMPLEAARALGADLALHPPPIPLPTVPMTLLWHPRQRGDPRHRFFRTLIRDALLARVEALGVDAPW